MRPIQNLELKNLLEAQKIQIVLNDGSFSPLATSSTILLSSEIIEQLSQEEFEAVIAHELEHVRWKDPKIKSLLYLFYTLFWWIPTTGWTKKIEQDQEMASDQRAIQHSSEECLAKALVKVTSHVKNRKVETACLFAGRDHSLVRRVKVMFNSYPKEKIAVFGITVVLLELGMVGMCLFI